MEHSYLLSKTLNSWIQIVWKLWTQEKCGKIEEIIYSGAWKTECIIFTDQCICDGCDGCSKYSPRALIKSSSLKPPSSPSTLVPNNSYDGVFVGVRSLWAVKLLMTDCHFRAPLLILLIVPQHQLLWVYLCFDHATVMWCAKRMEAITHL